LGAGYPWSYACEHYPALHCTSCFPLLIKDQIVEFGKHVLTGLMNHRDDGFCQHPPIPGRLNRVNVPSNNLVSSSEKSPAPKSFTAIDNRAHLPNTPHFLIAHDGISPHSKVNC
jgi:hypothetical protein